jgi:methionyl-tRNA synthetase
MTPYYVTTPIYYVNDRPHIGHCFTSLVGDVAARFMRLLQGGGVFFLTGTDEHADKVVTSAAQHFMSPIEWADRNAAEFRRAFAFMDFTNDDFIRTTEDRHKSKVEEYIRELQERGDVYLGDYVGWFDESQEEYLTETVAKESKFGPYTSPVTGKPLVKRTEKNYFFRLSAYERRLADHIASNPRFILPEARRNEVLGRLRQGLQDIPISRAVTDDPSSQWGIRMPDDQGHRIYVWIDALFNYLTVVDTPERKGFWPPAVHTMAKDILWFHAVIWPCMLMALGRPLPRTVFAHSYWVREGVKMSKSLGNFVTLEVLQAYASKYSLDAVRWYLITQGPMSTTDADFSHAKFVEVYNAELANGLGNSTSRVSNMIAKYFDGKVPAPGRLPAGAPGADVDFAALCSGAVARAVSRAEVMDLGGSLQEGVALVRQVDQYINITAPFKLAKLVEAEPARRAELGAILYNCAETLRIASVLMSPALTRKCPELWAQWNCAPAAGATLKDLCAFGGAHALRESQSVVKGEALFMRADAAEAAPA